MTDSENRSELLAELQKHADKVDDVKQYCTNEANTRGVLVEPLLEILGYDCRDPREVDREFTADVAGKKGEKVDYVVIRHGQPILLVEAKTLGHGLGRKEIEQLQRYFPFTPARLAVLTDGVRWRWFKGMSEPSRSHEMETSPFLRYDAREPSGVAAEWLYQVTKDGFNPDELLRIARRIELTSAVREWIDKTLVAPGLDDARRFNATASLGASDDEIPLVLESMQSAWGQLIGDTIVDPGPVAHVADNTDADDLAEHPTTPIDPGQTGAAHSSRSQVTLEFESHWDERLDLGNGKVLDANRLPRAWRIGDTDWNVEKNGTATTTSVLAELLRCDARNDEHGDLAIFLGLHYSSSQPEDRDLRPIPGFPDIYWNRNVTNWWKSIKILEYVASEIEFDPPPDSPLANNPRIEWWLPNKPKRRSG